MTKFSTHSPPFTLFMPKLEPTIPVHLQAFLSPLVHEAVAMAPGFKHVIAAKLGTMKRTRYESLPKKERVIEPQLQDEYD